MRATAKKSTTTTSTTVIQKANRPFFAKAGGGDFFAPKAKTTAPFIQAKMSVNKPGDKFEQEADKMADKVIRMPAPPSPMRAKALQRQTDDELQKRDQEEIQKEDLPEEQVQKQEQEEIQKAEPEEQVQKQEQEEIQKAEPEEQVQKQEQEEIQKAEPEEQVQKQEDEKIQQAPAEEEKLQRRGFGTQSVDSVTQSAIHNKVTGGQPLSSDVRGYMEPRFNADFSNVRVHSNAESAGLSNRLSARAFTYQNHIFFSREQYQPGTSEGKKLLAHELTHTIQQGHAVQRSRHVTTTPTQPHIQRSGGSRILNWIAKKAYHIPGFRMFTIILGVNPINMSKVDRSAANILRALIEFMPGGALITQALDNHGIVNKVADWLEKKIKALGMVGGMFKNALDKFIGSLGMSDLAFWNWGNVWDRAKRIFTAPIDRLIAFAKGVVKDLFKFVKDAILRPLAALAKGTRGYDLLRAILGQDPITGEPVPRTAETIIGGFMKLIGREDIWENIKKGNAIARAWAWFQGALSGLMKFVRSIPGQIIKALSSITWKDVITIVGVFAKVGKAFLNIGGQFFSWAGRQVISLLEIIFTVVAPKAVPYIKRAKGAFRSIIQNPIRFVRNLVRAGKLGFRMFASRIGHHLKTALIKWIVGPLGEAGVYIPQSFSLMEIIKLVLSVLGLTWQNIRAKLVKIIPDPVLAGLEKTVGILVTLVKEGPVAAWEQIKSELSELKDMLIAKITEMVTSQIVKAAVVKLASMLNPAGAVIQAIIAIYNTISFFIEKASQIAAVVGSFINSISAIAAGRVKNAAKKVEQTMANTLTVVIAFLAKFAGLGNIPAKLVGIIKKIRKPIDKGLDKIVAWLGKMLKKFVDKVTGHKVKNGGKLNSKGVKQAVAFELRGKSVKSLQEEKKLANSIYAKYHPKGLKSIRLFPTATGISVLVGASIVEEVAKLNLKDDKGQKELIKLMNKFRYLNRSTYIYTYYEGVKIHEVRNFRGHAERQFVLKSLPKVKNCIIEDLRSGKLTPTSSVTVHLDMTRTPCNGCAQYRVPEAINFLKSEPLISKMDINLNIEATALTQGKPGFVGLEILMDQKNVKVKASDFWSVILSTLQAYPQFYNKVTSEHWTVIQLNDFKQKSTDLQVEIDNIVEEKKSCLKDIKKG